MKKQQFIVEEGETIDDCLSRMKKQGYTPVQRIEKPVLKEVKKNGKAEIEIAYQRIVFEGVYLNSTD